MERAQNLTSLGDFILACDRYRRCMLIVCACRTNEQPIIPPCDTPDVFTEEHRGQVCQGPGGSEGATSPSVAHWHRNKGKAHTTSTDSSTLSPLPFTEPYDAGKLDSPKQGACSITFPVSPSSFSADFSGTLSSFCDGKGTTANFDEHLCQQQASYANFTQALTFRAVPTISSPSSSRNSLRLPLNGGPTHTDSAMGVGPFMGMSTTMQTQVSHIPSSVIFLLLNSTRL